MINISKIMFYGRYFDDEDNKYEISWWLCVDDYEIYHIETLFSEYSYESISEIEETSNFVPLFKTDILQLEKEFINKLNNKTLLNSFSKILLANSDSYDVAFRVFIEREFLVDYWSEFEKSQLQKDAIAWCKQNHIPYTM